MKRLVTMLLALVMVLALPLGVLAEDAEITFTPENPPIEAPALSDIEGHWGHDVIMRMYSYGILNGYPGGEYRPDNSISRAEFANILFNSMNIPKSSAALPFADMEDHWAYDAVNALYQIGVIKGVSETSFQPETPILRQDAAQLLYMLDQKVTDFKLTLDPSKDVNAFNDASSISEYARAAMAAIVQGGIFKGNTLNQICPLDNISRAEAAQTLVNSMYAWPEEPIYKRISQSDWAAYKKEVKLSNGLKMSYIEMGNPDGEPLLLIHGSTDTSRSWSLPAPYLAEKYHLYIPDVRNHGETGGGDDEFTMRRMGNGTTAHDVICFMDAVGLERASIAGHSRGARISQTIALSWPERVNRMMLISGRAVTSEGSTTYYEEPFTKSPIDSEFMDWWYYNDAPVDEDFLSMAKFESSWLPLEAWRSIGGYLAGPDKFNSSIPMLVMYGEDDFLMNETVRDAMQAAYGDKITEYYCYPGMGHNPQWEKPAEIAKVLVDFMEGTTAAKIAPPADYPVAEKPAPPVAATGAKPPTTGLPTSISQGDWVNFKKTVTLESGIDMAYIEMGNPNGEPLLLLHGSTDSSRSWTSIVEYFVDDYHLYIPDQRGHGDTSKPDMKSYGTALYAYDAACFIKAMGLDSVSVVGHSMGTFNAQGLAMDYPELVDKIILIATRALGENSEDPADAKNPYILGSGEESPLTWDYMTWWYSNPNPIDPVFHYNAIMESWNLPLKCWASIQAVSYQARLLVDTPVMVIFGDLDFLMGEDSQVALKSQFDQAGVDYVYVTYKNRGHNVHWEEPELVSKDIKNFLNGKRDQIKDHNDLVAF